MLTLTPTHVQVAVLRTKDLIVKGKNGTNDVYIVYSLGKEKYQSSLKEKASASVLEWNEGCDIMIPSSNGNKAEVILKVMHKAALGDKCLGRLSLPLADFDVTGKARPIWYQLKPKPGNEKDTKQRGEIEVKISFLIKAQSANNQSTQNLEEKVKRRDSFKSSLGSILSLGKKSKKKKKEKEHLQSSRDSVSSSSDSLRNQNLPSARINMNNKLPIINDDPGVLSEEEVEDDQASLQFKFDDTKSIQSNSSMVSGSCSEKSSLPSTPTPKIRIKTEKAENFKEIDLNGEDVDFDFNNAVGNNSPNQNQLCPSPKPRAVRLPSVIVEEPSPGHTEPELDDDASTVVSETFGGVATSPPSPQIAASPKLSVSASMSNLVDAGSRKGSITKAFMKAMFASSKHLSVDELFQGDGTVVGSNASSNSNTLPFNFPTLTKKRGSIRDLGIPKEIYKQYQPKSKEELIAIIIGLQSTVDTQKKKINDMEDYIDKLLLRVLDNMPDLLKKANSVRHAEPAPTSEDCNKI